jgi:pimeloyl-ACP methyl ester carboxylesterase
MTRHEGAQAVLVGCIVLSLVSAVPRAARADGETLREVVFSGYADNAANPELVRRLLSPLAAARLQREAAASGRPVAGQSIRLADERFLVYVPSQRAPAGYGLVVFVPPWQDARLPQGWARVLDRFGMIFVSAARSGNDENALGRREPLALLAAHNITQRYRVDPERLIVAGFSGGSRVALRLALGYPDVFRGVLLNAGSDPIGSADVPLPGRDVLARFQERSRIVYVTGERDVEHARDDLASLRSLRDWCIYNADSFQDPRVGHEAASAASFARALGLLASDVRPQPARLAACRSAVDEALAATLRDIEALNARGRRAEAGVRLRDVDARFGGLAAPRSVDLATAP